jgi:hypothetical protein
MNRLLRTLLVGIAFIAFAESKLFAQFLPPPLGIPPPAGSTANSPNGGNAQDAETCDAPDT